MATCTDRTATTTTTNAAGGRVITRDRQQSHVNQVRNITALASETGLNSMSRS